MRGLVKPDGSNIGKFLLGLLQLFYLQILSVFQYFPISICHKLTPNFIIVYVFLIGAHLIQNVHFICENKKKRKFNIQFLACLYGSTESYCSHFDTGMGVGVGATLRSFTSKFFMLWARHCQMSYPVWGQVLLILIYLFT